MRQATSKTAYLDGIRGLAALIVIAGHASNFGMPIIPGIDLTGTAKAGVWLFFMLSAYLLTNRLRQDLLGGLPAKSLRTFALRRLFRIMPLYAVVLAILALIGWMPLSKSLAHMVLAEGDLHFWTIPVEMTFYALLPILLSVLRTPRAIYVFAAASVVISLAAGPEKIAQNSAEITPYLVFFASGMVLSVIPKPTVSAPLATGIIAAALLGVAIVSPRVIDWAFDVPLHDALAFAFLHVLPWGALIAFCGSSRFFRSVFASAPMRLAGSLSFAAYLIHYPAFDLATRSGIFNGPFAGGSILLIVGVASWVLHQAIEVPFINLGSVIGQTKQGNASNALNSSCHGHEITNPRVARQP